MRASDFQEEISLPSLVDESGNNMNFKHKNLNFSIFLLTYSQLTKISFRWDKNLRVYSFLFFIYIPQHEQDSTQDQF